MRFKMRTSSSFVVLVMLMMMASQICHPSLANESRDQIDDHAPDEIRNRIFPPFPYQQRFGASRAGSARPGPPQLRLNSWTRLSRAGPLQAGPRGDPQSSEDLTVVDTPPSYHSQIGHQAPPPAYNPPPSYDQLFPQRSPRAPSPSQSRQSAVNRAPTTISIESMEARTVFTVILPQIERERPTLHEMRLKGQVRKADANNYEFVFKASDIVRQGGRRKIVRCSVQATRNGRGLRDFRVSGLTCELSRRNLLRWGRSERYYPVRNRNFEEKFQYNGYEKVRNRIFPPFPVQRQNWVGVVNVPVNRRRQGARPPPPPPQGLPAHLANLPIEDRHPPPLYSGLEREGPPPPYANLGQPAQPLSAADILQPPPAYDQIYPNGPRPAPAAGLARRNPGLGQFGADQRAERNPMPNLNPRPNPGPFNAQSRDARRIFYLITPKIQRERLTLSDMRMKDATKIEGTPSYEFVFKATDIVRPGGGRKTVRCSVRANLTPMIRDFTISALTCERTRRNLQGWVTSNRYYPAMRGKRESFLAFKIHNRVAPVNRRYRWQSGSAQSVSSNESVVGQNPLSHQHPGSAQPDNPSRPSLSRPEPFNPMRQTYIQRSRQFFDARQIFYVITPKIQHERQTLQEMRLEKARMIDGTVPSYKFDFKASDIVRQSGRRKPVRCSVRADVITGRFHMISQSDLVISELTCERLSRKRWSKPKQYYPVRNLDFEKKSQLGDLEQVRNRIFPFFPHKHNANPNL